MKRILYLILIVVVLLTGIGYIQSDDASDNEKEGFYKQQSRAVDTIFVIGNESSMTIQEAIDSANPGDTVRVYAGTFYENLVIDKAITLIGNGSSETIINGSRLDNVILIKANWVNVSGFKIEHSRRIWTNQDAGIKVKDANNALISENLLTDNSCGIALDNSDSNTVENNICISNKNAGILVYNYSDYNTIDKNLASENIHGIVVSDYCTNNFISNNTATSSYRYHGINLQIGCNYNVIYNNVVKYNTDEGIYLYNDCDYNLIIYNTAEGNYDHGIILQLGSKNNTIYYNRLISNFIQAQDDAGSNQWDKGTDGGNYWSDWTVPDANNDGIVDNPYEIKGLAYAKDNYPFDNIELEKRDPSEATEPEIIYTIPADNSKNVPVDISEITIGFSKSMDISTVESSLSISPELDYFSEWSDNSTILKLILKENAQYLTSYEVRIEQSAEDAEGVSLKSSFTFKFSTESPFTDGDFPGDDVSDDDGILNEIGIAGFFVIILILAVLAVLLIIFSINRKRRVRMYVDSDDADERQEFGGKFTDEIHVDTQLHDDLDLILKDSKKKALTGAKPSDFVLNKKDMLTQFKRRYKAGEISQQTYESIKEILIERKP